jgi:hypothetical protein
MLSDKIIKSAGEKVYSIGFPASEIEKGKLSCEEIFTKIESQSFELKNELVIFCLNNSECKQGYKEWVAIQHKNKFLVQDPAPIYSKTNNSGINLKSWGLYMNFR